MKTNTLFACVIVVLVAAFSSSVHGQTSDNPQVNYEQQVKTNLKELNQQLETAAEDTVISSLHSTSMVYSRIIVKPSIIIPWQLTPWNGQKEKIVSILQ